MNNQQLTISNEQSTINNNSKLNHMSLQQVNAFYEMLTSDKATYEQYYNKCSSRGIFGIWNWDTNKIMNFAANLGYTFTESELEQVLFDEPRVSNSSLNLLEYGQLSAMKYQM
jgi:Nif11 domain